MEISKTLIKYRYPLLFLGLITLGVVFRLIPHLPNFAPIGAIAIAAGLMFRWRYAMWLPIIIMVISDITIGLYHGFLWTWLSLAIIPLLGVLLRQRPLVWQIPLGSMGASLLFFIISNFGVWVSSGMYSHTLAGLIDCFVMALPFLRSTMLSDILFTSVLLVAIQYGAVILRVRPLRTPIAL